MQLVPRSSTLRPIVALALRLVTLLAWVGQLAVLGAPLLEARAGTSTAPHVEAHTNPLHHAHNPDLCPACAAQALVGRPESGRAAIVETIVDHATPTIAPFVATRARRYPASRPRAPPVWMLESRSPMRFDVDSHTTTEHALRNLALRARPERVGHRARPAA
jgi:hypothetical protein